MPRRSKLNPLVLATSVFLLRAASVWAGEAATTGLTVGEFARMEKGEVVVKTHTYATGGMTSAPPEPSPTASSTSRRTPCGR